MPERTCLQLGDKWFARNRRDFNAGLLYPCPDGGTAFGYIKINKHNIHLFNAQGELFAAVAIHERESFVVLARRIVLPSGRKAVWYSYMGETDEARLGLNTDNVRAYFDHVNEFVRRAKGVSDEKIDNLAAAAFLAARPFKSGNTKVLVRPASVHMYLHGNEIARRTGNKLRLTLAGYFTATTRARLNALYPEQVRFIQKNHIQQLHVHGRVFNIIDPESVFTFLLDRHGLLVFDEPAGEEDVL